MTSTAIREEAGSGTAILAAVTLEEALERLLGADRSENSRPDRTRR